MVDSPTGIAILPNEILMKVLSYFPTCDLLPLTPTSRRIHALILRVLETRLLRAAALTDHTLILEVFHPSTKLSTPYLLCKFLGIGSLHALSDHPDTSTLGQMHEVYSHFRPLHPEEDRKTRRPHPAGGPTPSPVLPFQKKQTEYVEQNINLESHELFTQLCMITNLVKVGPKRGLFLSCVNIGEGITRIWRDWLAERCASISKRNWLGSGPNIREKEDEEYRKRLLWADTSDHVGLRMRAIEREDVAPVLVGRDEDAPVSYTLQYEELVIRTTQLLLMVEQSLDQEVNDSGLLCGLDGEYLPAGYEGDVSESFTEAWREVCEAFSGGPIRE